MSAVLSLDVPDLDRVDRTIRKRSEVDDLLYGIRTARISANCWADTAALAPCSCPSDADPTTPRAPSRSTPTAAEVLTVRFWFSSGRSTGGSRSS
ncbi:hypothetical protein FVA95_22680 [Pseudonocardia sp. EV170527-09]|uniref:hypothetical protein n=1 Tax=Pseudonocardia sp. EV170527-09 TaxID=2603411 RepID=UPI0011F30952|nr:hypothetical protein [Pseudonocardia sp. EV170527-09]KAA1019382.1 hypothetical protein FVA95_22680 [Pseudonocardia sp. EV170527-09]